MSPLALSLFASLVAACAGAPPAPSAPPMASAASTPAKVAEAVKPPGEAKVGDHTRCPVSGEEFDVEADSPKLEYQGKTYYFCCPPCIKKFQKDPQKYLSRL